MTFLASILDAVRAEVRSPTYLRGLPERAVFPPASLRERLASAPYRWAVMVEYKRRSPGARAPNLPERTVDEFARLASRGGAAALSCLATRPGFDGSVLDVHALVRSTCLPVLFKDFVIDERQIEAASRAGASAVLLIARLETEERLDRPLAELADAAHRSGLEVLLEFHAPEELKVAGRVDADMYGVNLRDLDGLGFEPEVVARTVREAPRGRPLLGLSGVERASDARAWRARGVDGILVGSGFARAEDPAAFLREVVRVGEDTESV
ncbi:MAG: hypothetical protein M1126_05865 [Candidatus Thermoplasmatota archaeon]|nr:hypothetical protein [Candidatus Thermoplasmatota archaeon]